MSSSGENGAALKQLSSQPIYTITIIMDPPTIYILTCTSKWYQLVYSEDQQDSHAAAQHPNIILDLECRSVDFLLLWSNSQISYFVVFWAGPTHSAEYKNQKIRSFFPVLYNSQVVVEFFVMCFIKLYRSLHNSGSACVKHCFSCKNIM